MLIIPLGINAQHVLRAEGEMPRDLRMGFEQMYAQDRQRVREFDQGRLRNKQDVQEASYAVNALLTSGRVLYGDPLTRWVNRIADTLLVNDPDLRKELRFYVVKSPAVNAYATGQGIIFVNLGLIAQLEDEAQLAYILSHEIVHYTRRHALQELTRNKRADARLGQSDELSALMRKHQRSKEMEGEADSLGLLMYYLPSGYRGDVGEGVFDVLQYAYLPFDEVPFDTNYFNTAHFRLPSELWLRETSPITARDDYADSLSTHPNILKRRQLVQRIVEQRGGKPGGKGFLCASEAEFARLRDLARYEVMRQHLLDFDHARALYELYLLEREHPEDSAYLRRCRAQALYSLARYRNHSHALEHPVPDPEEIEGEQQRVYHLLRNIPKEYLTIIALREELKLGNRCEAEELMRDLRWVCGLRAGDFLFSLDTAAPAQDTAATGKYSRIRKKRSDSRQASPIAYAFLDLAEGQPDLPQRLREGMSDESLAGGMVTRNRPGRVLLLDPTYLVYNARAEHMDYPKSVSQEARLAALCRATLAANGQELVAIDDSTTAGYNDYMALTEYLHELASCLDDYEQRLFTQPQANEALDRLECDQLQLAAVANVEWPARERTLVALYSINGRTGRLRAHTVAAYSLGDSDALLKRQLYATQRRARLVAKDPDCNPHRVTPGYLGHRLLLGVGLTASPSPQLLGKQREEPPVNLSLTPTAEWLLDDDKSLRLSYNLRRHAFGGDPFAMHTVGLTYALYRQPVAPLGYYFSSGALVSLFTRPGAGQGLFGIAPGITIEGGRNFLLFDHLVLSPSVGTTLTLAVPFEDQMDRLPPLLSNPEVAGTHIGPITWLSNVLYLKLTIGIL